jgi:hypothetical protein
MLALIWACNSPRLASAQATTSAPNGAGAAGKTKTATATATKPKTVAKNSTSSHSSAVKSSKSASAGRSGKAGHASLRKSSRKKTLRGQQKIDSERAQAIQEALIREHYLSGTAAGTWNQSSEDAMRRYQADHGWQSKTVPDSRALISLGLGPSNDHLLNPESAMTTGPAPRSASLTPASHSADPGPRMSTRATSATESTSATTASGQDRSGPQ